MDLNNKNTPENILRCENEYCNKYCDNCRDKFISDNKYITECGDCWNIRKL